MKLTDLLPLLALSLTASAQDGGIEIFAGETLFREGTRVSLTQIWQTREGLLNGSSSVADPLDQVLRERRTVLGFNYGLARNWSISALAPFVERELDTTAGDMSSSGIGDVSLILKHRFHFLNWRRGAWNTSWIFGVEFPSGSTSERAGAVRLMPNLQPGSGSVDPFAGIASTLSLDRFRYDFVAFYKENTEGAQDFEEGDKLTLSLAGKYRYWHEKYPGPSASVTVALKWGMTSRAESFGVNLANSGGDEFLFRIATGIHPRPDMDLSLSLDIPLHEDFNGTQLGLDTRVQLALGWRF